MEDSICEALVFQLGRYMEGRLVGLHCRCVPCVQVCVCSMHVMKTLRDWIVHCADSDRVFGQFRRVFGSVITHIWFMAVCACLRGSVVARRGLIVGSV